MRDSQAVQRGGDGAEVNASELDVIAGKGKRKCVSGHFSFM
jgi:hypothetical protein